MIVTLKTYYGRKMYDENQNLVTRHSNIKLHYGRLEWNQFVKNAKQIGITSAEVVKCISFEKREELEITQELIDEVNSIFQAKERVKTPEERIEELEALVKKLSGGASEKPKKKAEDKKQKNEDEDLEALRAEYHELYGKKPSHLMKAETLREKIAEKKITT